MSHLNSINLTTHSGSISELFSFEPRFNGKTCLANITTILLNNTSLIPQNPSIFFLDSTPTDPILTLSGCNALCGSKWGAYPDDGPRIYEWIIPGLLLVANMHFPSIGRRKRYLILAQLLGNPVACMWRLLYLVEDAIESSRLANLIIQQRRGRDDGIVKQFKIRDQEIAVIILAAARLLPSIDIRELSKRISLSLDVGADKGGEALCRAIRENGIILRDQRSHDVRRTGFAILIYILQVIAVFVAAVGGSTNPSGGKVAPALLLIWLLPVVLLSNAIGDYGCWVTSRRTLFDLLELLHIDIEHCIMEREVKNSTSKLFFTELACSGAVVRSHPSQLRRMSISILSVMPISLACVAAFTIDMTGPTWFSCRATASLCSLAWWLLSGVVTGIMLQFPGKHIWRSIWLKDIIFAIPILVFVLLSAGGFFNSCFCTSGAIVHGSGARVVLNQSASYPFHNNKFYPAVVSTGIVIQLLIPILAWVIQRQGFRTIWWSSPLAAEVLERRYVAPSPEVQLQIGKVVGVTTTPASSTAPSLPAEDDDNNGPMMASSTVHLGP